MKQQYIHRKFNPDSMALIDKIETIVDSYRDQGFVLTVRQLYYQLVARAIIPNNERSYKNTCSLVNDARLAGLIDWDMIEDRTRSFVDRSHWEDGKQFLDSVAPQFYADHWEGQPYRVFVMVEKEALVGVLENLCRDYDVPLLAARGYPSASVLREFAVGRLRRAQRVGAQCRILHLGDHDPSGIDMTRDLEDRIGLFNRKGFELHRIALNMDQIEEKQPPPNPAKTTDARSDGYIRRFGHESWELDALEPAYLVDLVKEKIDEVLDDDVWNERREFIQHTRERLVELAKGWDE